MASSRRKAFITGSLGLTLREFMDLWHGCWTAEAVEADWLPDGFHEVVGFEEGGDGYPMDWIAGKN